MIRLMTGTELFFSLLTTLNAQDVAAGEKSFNKCRACHQIGDTDAAGRKTGTPACSR
jgi:cytochrome c2